MTFSEAFQVQWKSFSDYIVSGLIKAGENPEASPYDMVSDSYRNELQRWKMKGQYNALWLDYLRQADAAVAQEFENALKTFTFEKVDEQAPTADYSKYIGAGIGGAAGLGISTLLRLNTVGKIGATAASAIAGSVIASKVSGRKNLESGNAVVNDYEAQLTQLGERLLHIVEKADGKEPTDF